jgi:hypothetical protein
VRIIADHAIVNRVTKLGTFFDASGYTQIAAKAGEESLLAGSNRTCISGANS